MAKSKFNDSWYVKKDRINLFIPFEKNLFSEISRVDGIRLVGNGAVYENAPSSGVNAHCGLQFNGNVVTCDAALSSMLNQAFYGGNQTVTLAFWACTISNNDQSSDGVSVTEPDGETISRTYITNNAVLADNRDEGYIFYTAGHTTTIAHADEFKNAGHSINLDLWKKKTASTSTELVRDGSDIPFDQPLGVWALHVIVMKHGEGADGPTSECSIHILYNDTATEIDGGGNVVISGDGQFNHYWTGIVNMDASAVRNRANGPAGASNQWTFGGCLTSSEDNIPSYSYFYRGTLRNLMLYNIALDFDEIETLFKHGIDPYEATNIDDTDVDSFDSNFWGKYGVIASNSDVKFEKCIIGDVTDNKDFPRSSGSAGNSIANKFSTKLNIIQNSPRFNIAGRDKSHLEVINRGNTFRNAVTGEVVSVLPYDVSNPTSGKKNISTNTWSPYDYGRAYQGNDLLSVGVWRNSFATGNGKIKFITPTGNGGYDTVSKAIGGSFIEGGTDLIRIDEDVNPETLPSGRYIAFWERGSYPSFLPSTYLRDRLGRSYKGYDLKTLISSNVDRSASASITNVSDSEYTTNSESDLNNSGNGSKYVNGEFWGNTARYEEVAWTKPRIFNSDVSDENFLDIDENKRIDLCSAWEPVYWIGAVYEVNNEPDIMHKGFFSTIRLVLINEDMTKSAVYYKLGHPVENANNTNVHIEYGDWQFDSFDSIKNIKDKERLARIYLPHVVIPSLKIPSIGINVDTAADINDSSSSLTQSKLIFSCGTYIKGSIHYVEEGGDGEGDGDGATWAKGTYKYFKPHYSGYYEFTWHFTEHSGDSNNHVWGILTVGGASIMPDGYLGDYVGGGSHGGSYSSTTVKCIKFIQAGQKVGVSWNHRYEVNDGGAWGLNVAWFTVHQISGGNYVTGVKPITKVNRSQTDINGVSAQFIDDPTNGSYWIMPNILAKYTRDSKDILQNGNPIKSYVED